MMWMSCAVSKTKTYQLFSNEKPTVATPSFSPNLDFRSPNLRKRVMHIETPERHGVDSSTRKSLGMISSLFGKKESAQPREERYLELSVWDPHPFFGNIFSFFSPAQALLLFLAWPSPLVKKLCGALLGHADQTPFLLMGAIVLGLQMQIVMRAYEGRRRDWNIVQGQVAAVQEDTAAVRYNQLRRNAIAAIKKWMGEAGALGSTPRHTSTPMKDPAVAAETTSPVPSYPDSPASSRKNVNNPFQSGRLSLDNVAPS